MSLAPHLPEQQGSPEAAQPEVPAALRDALREAPTPLELIAQLVARFAAMDEPSQNRRLRTLVEHASLCKAERSLESRRSGLYRLSMWSRTLVSAQGLRSPKEEAHARLVLHLPAGNGKLTDEFAISLLRYCATAYWSAHKPLIYWLASAVGITLSLGDLLRARR